MIPVRVRFGFEFLARTDLFQAVETLQVVLHHVGFRWDSEIVSRVAMQVLLPVDIDDFTETLKSFRVVTRYRGKYQLNANMDTMRMETITLSSKNAELCIYDKRAHLLAADPVYFSTFCKEILQDGEIPQKLTRVEFRFRRPMLERYGITTFKDLKASQCALPQVFGRDWFRILERDKIRGSENEIPNAPIWERTMKAFEHYFSGKSKPPRTPDDLRQTPKPPKIPQVDRLVKQAAGLLSSAASSVCEKFTCIEEVWEKSSALLKRYAEPMYFKGVLRQIDNAVKRGYTADNRPAFSTMPEIHHALSPEPYYPECVEFR